MTAARPAVTADVRGPSVLVWIDARAAVVVRWTGGGAAIERLASDVPAHRRSTGHVRHDPSTRHGGGGAPQDAGEGNRIAHLDRFVESVAGRLEADADVVLLGSGTVHERLETRLRELDLQHGRDRLITSRPAARLTEPQLVAELRAHIGAGPRRRRVGT